MTKSGIRRTPLYAAALALAVPASAMAANKASKVHDCGDGLKIEVFQPKEGAMEARVEDLTVRISVREGDSYSPAGYSVSVVGIVEGAADEADEALSNACAMIATVYKTRNASSAEERRKQLSDLYDRL